MSKVRATLYAVVTVLMLLGVVGAVGGGELASAKGAFLTEGPPTIPPPPPPFPRV